MAAAASRRPATDSMALENQAAIAAIMLALAAVEAFTNFEWEDRDSAWLAAHKRKSLDFKWAALMKSVTGTSPPSGGGLRNRLRSATGDRNLVAHYRGVPMRKLGVVRSGPPARSRRGNISQVRAYFTAARAERDVRTAWDAITEYYKAASQPLPGWLRDPL